MLAMYNAVIVAGESHASFAELSPAVLMRTALLS